ncbi:MAG: Lipid A export ATP-binding/permease protein MsbA [Elusimicrobia bacterium]|nr:Lipid A export ATP-binding/permease protein MsbA [Elusimicrobiota bacterium]
MVRRIIPYLKPVWFRYLIALVCMSGVAALSTGFMWLIKYLNDYALVQRDVEALRNGVFLVLFGIGLKSILWYIHTYLTSYASQTVSRQIRDDLYKHLYSLSMGFFNEKASGGILARLTSDITLMQSALSSSPTVFIRDGLTILGLIGFLLYANFKFALICFSVLPVAAWFLANFGGKSRRAGRESQAKMSDIYTIIHEALAAMPIVKVFQSEKREIEDFTKENRRYFDTMMKLVRVDARSSPIMEFLGAIVLALMLWVGGRDVINGVWSIGSFVAFVGAAMSLYNPIKKFASVNVQFQQGMAAAERVFELMDQKGTVSDAPDAVTAQPITRSIEFHNVSFSYPSSNLVLDSINLTIYKGDVIALVGASGSGKTTLAQLLLRFYDPTQGSITLDGVDFRKITLHSLRNQMSVVTQDTHLFNDTVLANIAYGHPQATQEEVETAAKAAFAHDFISALPMGYQTVIGERGARISGGEKQRISIARSILKNPAILVLDEATSALDVASEQAVQKALDRLLEGRTVIMIAHRLSTVRKAHRIVFMDKGQIKEIGNHEQLLSKKGAYHDLYSLQSFE